MGTLAVSSENTGWTWNGSEYSFFTVPGAARTGTLANGVNNTGQVVGYFQDASGVYHGFLKDGEDFTTIDAPDASATFV